METTGTVRLWNDEEGWGVIDSDATPGGCWAHYSDVAIAGYRTLQPGQAVSFEWEAATQDGFRFRATRAWPAGTKPTAAAPPTHGGDAYSSALEITFDD